jgi:hypothetical protein
LVSPVCDPPNKRMQPLRAGRAAADTQRPFGGLTRMKFTESTWSPFQSAPVRDICAHLSAAERGDLFAMSAQYGRASGWRFAVPFAAVVMSIVYSRLAR